MESGSEGALSAGAGVGSGAGSGVTASLSEKYHCCRGEETGETGWGARVSVKAGSASFSAAFGVLEGCVGVGLGACMGANVSS